VLTVSRTDGTPTSAANNYFTQVGTGFAIPNAPVEALQALVGYNTLALTVGQAPSATGTGTWFIWPEGYEGL
jgi:hypothetical protein